MIQYMWPEELTQRFADAQKRLVTQASDFSLETIASMVESRAIDPSPEYQRRQRWDHARQSALIESFLLNVPVPPVYLAEEEFGVYSVIDGKQRITAITEFMRGRLQLRGLTELGGLNGYRIADLPEVMGNALRVRPYVRAVTLLKQTDPELKYEVFLRLNRGGQTLTAQEVRHVAFRGPLNDMLLDLAANEFLLAQFNIEYESERFRQMQDVEYVLRYLTLEDEGNNFRGDLSVSMDRFMFRHQRSEPQDLGTFRNSFLRAIDYCQRIWGDKAFRRAESGAWRGRALLGMYDAQMLAVQRTSHDALERAAGQSQVVLDATERLFDDREFLQAVTVSTNTPAKLYTRVERVERLLSAV
jgi:hypothetical protein